MFFIDPDRDAFMEIQSAYCIICSRVLPEDVRYCEISDCPHRKIKKTKITTNDQNNAVGQDPGKDPDGHSNH